MTNSWRIRETVINGYLGGKSFDEIASESSIAKGSVFNIINAWKNRIEIPDIEDLREFSKTIRKSGITINQCAQSFRFIRILDSFGITDEPESSYFQNIDTNYRYTSESKDSLIDPNKSNGERKKHHSLGLRQFLLLYREYIIIAKSMISNLLMSFNGLKI